MLSSNQFADLLNASSSTSYGGFDDEMATVKGMLARIVGSSKSSTDLAFEASTSHRKDSRIVLQST